MHSTSIQLILLLLITPSYSQFSQVQTLTEKVFTTQQIDISDDGSIMVASDWGKIYVYVMNNGLYSHQQTVENGSFVLRGVDLTADGKYLLQGSGDTNLTIYENVNNNFVFYKAIPHIDDQDSRSVAMTDDYEWVF